MKRILFFSFCILYSVSTNAQKLSFEDLKYLFQNDIELADVFLTKKGFSFMEATNANENTPCPSTDWAYHRNTANDKSLAFVQKLCNQGDFGFVWYQPDSKETLESIKSSCKIAGFKLKTSNVDSIGSLCFTYTNSKYQIEFNSGINSENLNVYSITLKLKN